MIDYDRLKAPTGQMEVLVEPDGGTIRRILNGDMGDSGQASFRGVRILDRTVGELRDSLRARLGLASPLIVTGHQTEFYHAGVFIKSIAAAQLAGACTDAKGSAAFLSVDSDTLKRRDLIVPQTTPGGLRRVAVPFTDAPLDLACESLPAAPREHWLEFFTRVASMLYHYPESLLKAFVDGWLECGSRSGRNRLEADTTIDFCEATAAGRAAVERALGLQPLRELRMSRLCSTPEFVAFVSHIVLDAGRFAEAYNAAQSAYRERFHIRSEQRPAPPLALANGRVEAPFWLLGPDGRRRRLFVSASAKQIELFAGAGTEARSTGGDAIAGNDAIGVLDTAELRTADRAPAHWHQRLSGWRVRPRALTLSAFARMFLADLFIHGIGGARYDAMTDDFSMHFFGAPPPPIACVTATLRLPLPTTGVTPDALRQARLAARDVRHNPQRRLANLPEDLVRQRRDLARRSDELRRDFPGDHAARRAVFEAIHEANARLLAAHPWGAARLDQRVEQLEQDWRIEQIALDREYFYALHRISDMRRLADKVREILQPGRGAAR